MSRVHGDDLAIPERPGGGKEFLLETLQPGDVFGCVAPVNRSSPGVGLGKGLFDVAHLYDGLSGAGKEMGVDPSLVLSPAGLDGSDSLGSIHDNHPGICPLDRSPQELLETESVDEEQLGSGDSLHVPGGQSVVVWIAPVRRQEHFHLDVRAPPNHVSGEQADRKKGTQNPQLSPPAFLLSPGGPVCSQHNQSYNHES